MEQKNKRNTVREHAVGKKNSDIPGGYPKILLMQLVLCAVIVASAVVLKYVSINTFADFKRSYEQIVSESYTGKLLNDNFNVFKNAVNEAFSYIDESDKSKKTGTSENVPVFFSPIKKRPPKGKSAAPLILLADVHNPLASLKLSSGFGYRINPVTERLEFHSGLDITAPMGDKIFTVMGGTVEEIGYSKIYGNYVIMNHGSGLKTRYCHCSDILARQGAHLRGGEAIAFVGSTGYSTGPHLHFEISHNGVLFDPAYAVGLGDYNEI